MNDFFMFLYDLISQFWTDFKVLIETLATKNILAPLVTFLAALLAIGSVILNGKYTLRTANKNIAAQRHLSIESELRTKYEAIVNLMTVYKTSLTEVTVELLTNLLTASEPSKDSIIDHINDFEGKVKTINSDRVKANTLANLYTSNFSEHFLRVRQCEFDIVTAVEVFRTRAYEVDTNLKKTEIENINKYVQGEPVTKLKVDTNPFNNVVYNTQALLDLQENIDKADKEITSLLEDIFKETKNMMSLPTQIK
ncbi:hypothetical protein FCV63_23815 [Vibrio lentus]|uniref:hypothetical protein n=1 Tax=Vibrio lentus TaxID=136468 RepID=UPI0010BDC803|nr:hypothetical protein [Vibrio lentus]TKF51052.1 hypothetical protein FCV63_23815 [Vibrio lentus]